MNRFHGFAVLLIVVFGFMRQPVEKGIASSLESARFREGNSLPDGPMREKLGQLGAAAALGGFRSFLATLYELRAITAYSDADYSSVESNYHLATQLQPREPGYWDTAAWMLDTNARRYYLSFDWKLTAQEAKTLARLSVRRGKKFLDDGIAYNPDDYVLHRSLGNHYVHRQEDFCRGAAAFARAADLVGRPGVAARHHAIYLALCPGKEREAYEKLRVIAERIREGASPIPTDMMPGSIVLNLRFLEGVLGIPERDRFPTDFNFLALYNRLRARWVPGTRYPEVHRIRFHRLEEILGIPVAQRIPY